MSLVSLVKLGESCTSFQEAIERSLELIDFKLDPKVRRIAIKPNLCYYWDYSTGETTDPKFVSALADVIRHIASHAVEISVVESDASAMKCGIAFKMLGYEKMAREKGVDLVNLTNDEAQDVEVKVGQVAQKFSIPQTIASADLLINVPKIKYMEQVKISCALKNIYGCNPFPRKYKYHEQLDETIVGLNKIMRARLCIVDGIITVGVKTLKLGLVMASTDPVAVDAAASKIIGLNPRAVKYLSLASKEKLGSTSFISKGESLDSFKSLYPRKNAKDKLRGFVSKVYNRILS